MHPYPLAHTSVRRPFVNQKEEHTIFSAVARRGIHDVAVARYPAPDQCPTHSVSVSKRPQKSNQNMTQVRNSIKKGDARHICISVQSPHLPSFLLFPCLNPSPNHQITRGNHHVRQCTTRNKRSGGKSQTQITIDRPEPK